MRKARGLEVPKQPVIFNKQSTSADELARLHYTRVRDGKGSHEKWRSESGRALLVPRNLKSRHTANAILKDAGSELRV